MSFFKFRNSCSFFLQSFFGFLFFLNQSLNALGTGLIPLTPEEKEYINQNWQRIVDIKPNAIGAERIRNHHTKIGLAEPEIIPATPEDEFVFAIWSDHDLEVKKLGDGNPLPSSVDNSTLPSFPPIGYQGDLGSCTAWSMAYYAATNEYGLYNRLNNKDNKENTFSPKWMYNNLNHGEDKGLNMLRAANMLIVNGNAKWNDFPYDTSNFQDWDLDSTHWIDALNYRFTPIQVPLNTAEDITTIKKLLANGHVLSLSTFVHSFVCDTIHQDPHKDESIVILRDRSNGAHCMTIVGYDDNIYVDINCNGHEDPGERGAFLVANQYDSSWGNKGFIWISYDAFLNESALTENCCGRLPITQEPLVLLLPFMELFPKGKTTYTPKLYALFTLELSFRDQMSVEVGMSGLPNKTPAKTIPNYPTDFNVALQNQGGPLEFDGTKPQVTHGRNRVLYSTQTATFAMDLTQLLDESPCPHRFYLVLKDNSKGAPTVLKSFSIVDNVNGKRLFCDTVTFPLTVDNQTVYPFIDYCPD